MDVEGAGCPEALTLPQRRSREAVREQPEIGTTRGRQAQAPPLQGAGRELGEGTGGARQPVRVRPALGIPILSARTPDREEAGVVAVAFLDQDVECPLPPRHDRETWRSEPQHDPPGDLLQHLLAAPHRIAELARRLLRHPHAIPPVRRDLVARVRDRADQAGLALAEPAEDEERRPGFVTREQLEQQRRL